VAVTGLVAILSLRQAHAESNSQRSHEFLLTILPRQLDALESAWRMIFELESGMTLDQEHINLIVEASIWLPRDLRNEIISLITHPEELSAQRVSDIRRRLEDSSGAPKIDALRSVLIEVPSLSEKGRRHNARRP